MGWHLTLIAEATSRDGRSRHRMTGLRIFRERLLLAASRRSRAIRCDMSQASMHNSAWRRQITQDTSDASCDELDTSVLARRPSIAVKQSGTAVRARGSLDVIQVTTPTEFETQQFRGFFDRTLCARKKTLLARANYLIGFGSPTRARTWDLRINSPSLSYVILPHHQLLTASAHLRHRSRMQCNAGACKTALLRFCIQVAIDD